MKTLDIYTCSFAVFYGDDLVAADRLKVFTAPFRTRKEAEDFFISGIKSYVPEFAEKSEEEIEKIKAEGYFCHRTENVYRTWKINETKDV